jgi:hypothetical protein
MRSPIVLIRHERVDRSVLERIEELAVAGAERLATEPPGASAWWHRHEVAIAS